MGGQFKMDLKEIGFEVWSEFNLIGMETDSAIFPALQ
jgi:hypothetical protein